MSDWRKELEGVFNSADAEDILMNDFEVDLQTVDDRKIAVIRTSDRNAFRSCRRKWNWSSHLRRNLGPKTNAVPLWFGSGFHFVMEDRHGLRRFADTCDAFDAYVKATLAFDRENVPPEHEELRLMAHSMLKYYEKWLKVRPQLPTYVVDGVPQVEISFKIKLPISQEVLDRFGWDEAIYSGTMDRVVIDENYGQLWVLDYKSVAMFNTQHLMTDSQITTYSWAASCMYDMPVAGMIYAQHKKGEVKLPKILRSGEMSSAQNQGTTAILYKEQILNVYGALKKAPQGILDYFKTLLSEEDNRQDKFIRYDYVPRNEHQQRAEGAKILLEAAEMLDPRLPLYPNATRDCTNMCSFKSACISFDDGSHWEDELAANFKERPREYDGWRKCLVWPGDEPEPEHDERVDWENL